MRASEALQVVRLGIQAADLALRIDAALAIHAPRCGRCCVSAAQCTGQEDWREDYDRHDPQLECPVCVASWGDEATEPYPCPTARALGVRAPSETTGEPA